MNTLLAKRVDKLNLRIGNKAKRVVIVPHGQDLPIPQSPDTFYIKVVAEQGNLAASLELTGAPYGATLTQPYVSNEEIDRQLIQAGIDPERRLDT